jgi:hypothetical protein
MTDDKKPLPEVRAGVRGQVNSIKNHLIESFRRNNPDWDVRFVYAPEDRGDLTKILQRRVIGYQPVAADELGLETDDVELFSNSKGQVRVGDGMMMKILKTRRMELVAETIADAREEVARTRSQYYDSVASIRARSSLGEERTGMPTGDIAVSEEVREVKFPNPNA